MNKRLFLNTIAAGALLATIAPASAQGLSLIHI